MAAPPLDEKQRHQNAQRAGAKGSRRLATTPRSTPSSLTRNQNLLEDRYLPVCDGRHDDRRRPPPPPTPTTTTDDGRRRAKVPGAPRPAKRVAEYPGGEGGGKEVGCRCRERMEVFVRRSLLSLEENNDDDETDDSNFERRTH